MKKMDFNTKILMENITNNILKSMKVKYFYKYLRIFLTNKKIRQGTFIKN